MLSRILTPKGWRNLNEEVELEEEVFEEISVSEELADFIDHLIEEGILEGDLEEGTLSELSYRTLQRYKDKSALDKRGHSTLYGKGKKRDRGIALATRKQQGKTGMKHGSDLLAKGPDKPVKVPASHRRQYMYNKPSGPQHPKANTSSPGKNKDKEVRYHQANVEPRGHTSIQYPSPK